MSINIIVGGAVYTHEADDTRVAVVLDLSSIDSENPDGPEGEQTNTRYVMEHAHAVQLGTLLIQHAGPTREGATDAQEESN